MGWGFSNLIGGSIGGWIDDALGIGGGAGTASADDLLGYESGTDNVLTDLAWTAAFQPGDLPARFPYTGGPFRQMMTGWPVQMSAELIGSPGSPPEGTVFLGHATPDLWFDRMEVSQSGADLVDNPAEKAGFSVRLLQRSPEGRIFYVSGFESGIDVEGTILREDLTSAAKTPFLSRVSYGGPITPFWPMYVTVQKYGDFGAVSGIDYLSVQVGVSFLAQTVQ